MNSYNEFVQLIRQQAQMQIGETKLHAWGHVSSYDPATHQVKVLLPTYRGSGGMVQSPWIQLASPWAGPGFGMQVAPFGGADQDDPSKGEACLIEIVEKSTGASVCAYLLYNDSHQPPDKTLAPGECLLKHTTGAYIKFLANGDIKVIADSGQKIHLSDESAQSLTAPTQGVLQGEMTDTATGFLYALLGNSSGTVLAKK